MQYDGFFGPGAKIKIHYLDPSERKHLSKSGILWGRSNASLLLRATEEEELELSFRTITCIELLSDPPQIATGDTVAVRVIIPIDGMQDISSAKIVDKSDNFITVQVNTNTYEIPWSNIASIKKVP